MRALAIVHQPDAGPGVFAQALRDRDWDLVPWLIAEHREPPGDPLGYDAVLTLGGAMHSDQEAAHHWLALEKALLASLLARGVPLLGVCLGGQLIAEAAGAPARRARGPEIGWYEVEVSGDGARDPLIGPLAPRFPAFEWHSYEFPLPAGAVALAGTPTSLQAYRIGERAWGIQFHAEVSSVDAEAWIDDYPSDQDAVRLHLDWQALRRRTRAAIGSWNALGRGLCERFLAVAEGWR
jgi:GMP synthase (glutamine-hydrolysing)